MLVKASKCYRNKLFTFWCLFCLNPVTILIAQENCWFLFDRKAVTCTCVRESKVTVGGLEEHVTKIIIYLQHTALKFNVYRSMWLRYWCICSICVEECVTKIYQHYMAFKMYVGKMLMGSAYICWYTVAWIWCWHYSTNDCLFCKISLKCLYLQILYFT